MIEIGFINVDKGYNKNNGYDTRVLNNFNFQVNNNEIVTILGPNGCGKTTVLNLIAKIIEPDKGEVVVKNNRHIKSNIGYIWQNYRASLLPWYNVGENIAYPLKISGKCKKDREAKSKELLKIFHDQIKYSDKTYSLSGGQQQLVNLLRCFSIQPDILLMDEPFSALDQSNQWKMVFTLEKIWLENKVPIIFVSHDIDEAIMLADRIVLMSKTTGNIHEVIPNNMPRPRSVKMLNSSDHIKIREKAICYLLDSRLTGVIN